MEELASIAQRYVGFAEREARGSSPSLERWALSVAAAPDLLERLAELPAAKRQPNLVFAALRWHGAVAGEEASLRRCLLEDWSQVCATITRRSTQTNEPARCAVLLPLLHQVAGPIALIELGAAAGLCLLPDYYSYRYSTGVTVDPPHGRSTVVIDCAITGPLPADLATPQITWRIGVDLNPLSAADPDTAAWLRTLVWPEHEHRRARLAAALHIAATVRPQVVQGNLVGAVASLVEQVPHDTTPVVMHCATLAYLDPESRAAVCDAVRASRARWLSFEGRDVVPDLPIPDVAPAADTQFVAALDGYPLALASAHGGAVTVLA